MWTLPIFELKAHRFHTTKTWRFGTTLSNRVYGQTSFKKFIIFKIARWQFLSTDQFQDKPVILLFGKGSIEITDLRKIATFSTAFITIFIIKFIPIKRLTIHYWCNGIIKIKILRRI